MRNVLLGLLLLPLMAAAQSTLIPQSGWLAIANPDIVLIVVLAWNLASPHTASILWAPIGGLVLDALSGGPMGTNVMALIISTMLANFTSSRVWESHILLRITVSVLASMLYYAVHGLVLVLSGWSTDLMNEIVRSILPITALNTVLLLILFPVAKWLSNRVTPRTIGM